jgi:hypothetical protein
MAEGSDLRNSLGRSAKLVLRKFVKPKLRPVYEQQAGVADLEKTLQLTAPQVQQMYEKFCSKFDGGSNMVSIEMVLSGFGLYDTELVQAIWKEMLCVKWPIARDFQLDEFRTRKLLGFEDFVLCLWNFCTLSKNLLLVSLFRVAGVGNDGWLELRKLMPFFKGSPGLENAFQQLETKLGDSITFSDLPVVEAQLPRLLLPCIVAQKVFKERFLGTSFWQEQQAKRKEELVGLFIGIEAAAVKAGSGSSAAKPVAAAQSKAAGRRRKSKHGKKAVQSTVLALPSTVTRIAAPSQKPIEAPDDYGGISSDYIPFGFGSQNGNSEDQQLASSSNRDGANGETELDPVSQWLAGGRTTMTTLYDEDGDKETSTGKEKGNVFGHFLNKAASARQGLASKIQSTRERRQSGEAQSGGAQSGGAQSFAERMRQNKTAIDQTLSSGMGKFGSSVGSAVGSAGGKAKALKAELGIRMQQAKATRVPMGGFEDMGTNRRNSRPGNGPAAPKIYRDPELIYAEYGAIKR